MFREARTPGDRLDSWRRLTNDSGIQNDYHWRLEKALGVYIVENTRYLIVYDEMTFLSQTRICIVHGVTIVFFVIVEAGFPWRDVVE